MAFRLRKLNPPFGTQDAPQWEFAYSEQVKVVDGMCDVQSSVTRDYLLKQGYEEIEAGNEVVLVSGNGSGDNRSIPKVAIGSKPRRKKKKRR